MKTLVYNSMRGQHPPEAAQELLPRKVERSEADDGSQNDFNPNDFNPNGLATANKDSDAPDSDAHYFDLMRRDPSVPLAPGQWGEPEGIEPLLGEPRTGVDTLRLLYPLALTRVPDFHVLTRREVKSRFGEHPLWTLEDGRRRWGVMAVRRVGAFRFRIAPVKPGGDAMLRCFFSAPRARFGHNGSALTGCELVEVLQEMQRILSDLGVEIEWPQGQVCRLDVCRDALLPRPCPALAPPFSLLPERSAADLAQIQSALPELSERHRARRRDAGRVEPIR